MTPQLVTKLPPPPSRPDDANKGTFGRVALIAGSPGMAGAAALSGLGALRGGAGLVYLLVPSNIASIVSAIEPSYIVKQVDIASADCCDTLISELSETLSGMSVNAIGPGLGTSPMTAQFVQRLYREWSGPLVLDADALNCLSQALPHDPETLSEHAGLRVLTPHPGEFARLTQSSVPEIQADRVVQANEFAQRHSVTLVLKGKGTIVSDGTRYAINPTGNHGMSTGGTGDVLTGLLSALLAQRLEAFEAAQLAVYLHGLSGDLAKQELSAPGLIASDLPRYLGRAWLNYLKDFTS